ncbi:hypothetical protein DFH11DRAFT_150397 [Phellopilus nigrolimitatus]|nr:hypothetical protein DFH11DRAFT_150397 [Phellopilus nigrolimitatus]
MPWSKYLRAKSERLQLDETAGKRPKSDLSALYHNVLLECFSEDRFDVFPRYAIAVGGLSATVHHTIDFVVEAFDGSPVLFLEIKPPTLAKASKAPGILRETEDSLMRNFRALEHSSALPKLYGVCAAGRKITCYEYNRETGVMSSFMGDERENVQAGIRWEDDIMGEEGYDRLMYVVDEIEWMVHALK